MASIFDVVEKGPPIEVFALNKAFLEDSSPDKVNLGVGGESGKWSRSGKFRRKYEEVGRKVEEESHQLVIEP
jgi:aspartate/tyrosine/aromatic aminotransferase